MVAFETPVMPDATSAVLLVAAGALMVGGHVGVFLAYKLASARSVAPFMYAPHALGRAGKHRAVRRVAERPGGDRHDPHRVGRAHGDCP